MGGMGGISSDTKGSVGGIWVVGWVVYGW